MEYSKQTVIEGLKCTIEQTEARIVELSKPCVKSLAFSRSEERDLLKKKVKNWKKRIKELEDESTAISREREEIQSSSIKL